MLNFVVYKGLIGRKQHGDKEQVCTVIVLAIDGNSVCQ